MRRLVYLFLFISMLFTQFAQADKALVQQKDVQIFIQHMVEKYNFNKQKLVSTLSRAELQPKIIESMEKPYEKKNWDFYKKIFLTQQRLDEGLQFWEKNQKTLEKAEKQFGVPAHIIVAVIGVETLYGKHQGKYQVIDALSTLAFNYPKRSKFFRKELRDYLLLCRELKIDPAQYKGSYAGAIGTPQFMPSSYRAYAVDFTGNGTIDLINSNADAIGSVANYFHKHGWAMNKGVVQPAKVLKASRTKIKMNSRKADYLTKQLLALGVKPETAALNPPPKAGLIELVTQSGQDYWIAYPNFYVITRYNASPQYALAVHLLSQQLKKKWALANLHKPHAYV